jgi:type IV pilus assembly protein PilN
MMRINLLPTKAARRHDTAKQEIFVLGGVLLVIIVGLAGLYTYSSWELDDWNERIKAARATLEAQKKDVNKVQDFKKKNQDLENKLKVIAELTKKRVSPTRMLDELATILTAQRKVWLTKIDEKNGNLVLEGGAMDPENVSEFQNALIKSTGLFRGVNLTVMTKTVADGVTYHDWKIICITTYAGGAG